MLYKKCKLLIILLWLVACKSKSPDHTKWEAYRGTSDANQFSALTQINTSNVHLLEPAWTYHAGDAGNRTTIECNPIIIGDVMYITSPQLKLIALNAKTGKEIWTFDVDQKDHAGGVNRGVTWYAKGKYKSILFSSGSYLYSVNAKNGELNQEFGSGGRIDLRENLGIDPASASVRLSSPGIIFNHLIIIGSAVGEGYNASPGHIRAYNAKTGEIEWTFHTIPKKGEFGHDTWKWVEGENYGGANNWSGMSIDKKRGWVFAATGSAAFDFYGANRHGKNLFANCVIALDASSGKRIWHYQAVHHDLWDYDLACAPNLVTIPYQGKLIDALVQPTKMGNLILLDRETGEPLIDAPEEPVPPSDIPGEKAYPTQKINQGIIITPQGMDENYLTNISPEAHEYALKELKRYRYGGMYIPPSLEGSVNLPSTRGGVLWGGASYNPETKVLYVNANEIPLILQIAKVEPQIVKANIEHEGQLSAGSGPGQRLYLLNCSSCHGADRQGVTDAFPEVATIKERLDRGEIREIITKGKGLMPPHTNFDENEIDHLVNYLLELGSSATEVVNSSTGMEKYSFQGYRIFTDEEGFPASKPPWGTLNAIDLTTQKILWKVPLGTYPALKERGIPDTGTQSFGGCVATAGGLIFIGGSADEKFRAYSCETGKELWSYRLPAGGYATPAVYEVDGKQYVVIAAGGGNRNGTPSGDAYIAFSLPEGYKNAKY
jgi:quinoprotein glucose dehydrogenase